MFGMMEALYNATKVVLVFSSKEDAAKFKAFVNAYMAQGGNGYNAYWVYVNAEIADIDSIPEDAVTSLDGEYVEHMLGSILYENEGVSIDYSVGKKRGAICFEFAPSAPVKTVALEENEA